MDAERWKTLSMNKKIDPEPWVRKYNGVNPVRLPNSPFSYEDYYNGYGDLVSTTFEPHPDYSQNIEDYH